MIDGMEQVRNVLGDQDRSGFSDQAIKDALWEFFFDVDKSVVYLLGAPVASIQVASADGPIAQRRNKNKRQPRNERVSFVHTIGSTFPTPSFVIHSDVLGHQLCYQIDGKEGAYLSVFPTPLTSPLPPVDARGLSLTLPPSLTMTDVDGKPLPPLPPPEHGHHQYGPLPAGMAPPPMPMPTHHPDYDEYADDGEYYQPDDYGSDEYPMEYNRLSTITERTERSEYSKHYPSARQIVYRDSISSNTEYGAFRGAYRSPCGQLVCSFSTTDSRFTATPVAHVPSLPQDSDSQSSFSTPRQRNALGLEMQTQDDYPPPPPRYDQYEDCPPSPAITESTIPPPPIEKSIAGTPKKSKLSKLADSRSVLSSAKSFDTLSSRSFAVDSSSVLTYPILRPSPASSLSLNSEFAPSETPTSASSHIRRAIDTAIEQERLDKLETKPEGNLDRSSDRSTDDGSSTATETPRPISQQRGNRGQSKLAQLAQLKAKQNPETIVSWVRPPSTATRRSRLPETQEHSARTKFLTPIGNGPTATTAITTSYQSLGNLTPRGVSGLPPSFPPPTDESRSTPSPVSTTSTSSRPKSSSSQKPPSVNRSRSSSAPSKPSKLAMKIKQAQQQKEIPEADVVEDMRDPIKPMFLPTGEPNAKPSPFASVLLDEDEHGKKSRRRRDGSRRSRHDDGEVLPLRTAGHATNPPTFAFDVPSPDDIVFNARKGTSLARQADARIKSGSSTPSRSSSHTVSSAPKRVSSTA